jgi:hypothetical protein
MHPLVRNLYQRFLVAGKHYPQGLSYVRAAAKKAFMENRDIKDDLALKRAVNKGRFWVREINAISNLHKYRTLRKKYGDV